ncbi:MAG: nucleotidyl transferase AbiEii/AbiGii toxin family protein [Kiritimatiellae bacterium]|nr:nucleotidyl transferase AbiEii/AbiGii toxin family protein [Kiritimatiellia bacterium]
MLHLETIESATLDLLKRLQSLSILAETRLVGGTALALQLGHRVSVDLDIFGNWNYAEDLQSELSKVGIVEKESGTPSGRMAFFYVDGIKVDCVAYDMYRWLEPPVVEEEGGTVWAVTVAKGGPLGERALPVDSDVVLMARRNPFGDKDNAEAKSVAADLAALGTQDFTDETGLAWKVKVSAKGVATISRTTGTGKKKKTISATAVVEVADSGGGDVHATARFLVSGKIVTFAW